MLYICIKYVLRAEILSRIFILNPLIVTPLRLASKFHTLFHILSNVTFNFQQWRLLANHCLRDNLSTQIRFGFLFCCLNLYLIIN